MRPEHEKIFNQFKGGIPKEKTQEFHSDKPYFIPYADLSKEIQRELDEIIKMRRYTAAGAGGLGVYAATAATNSIARSEAFTIFVPSVGMLHYSSWVKRNSLNKIQRLIAEQRDVVKNRVAHPNLPDAHKIAETHSAGYVAGLEKGIPKSKNVLFSANDVGIVLCPNSAMVERAKRKISEYFNKSIAHMSGGFFAPVRGRFNIEIELPKEKRKH